MRKAFQDLDVDGTVEIGKDHLRKLLTKGGAFGKVDDSKLDEMMIELDKDGDGKIQYEEFISIISS